MGAKKVVNTVRRVAGAALNPISFAKGLTKKKVVAKKPEKVKIENKTAKKIKSHTERNLKALGYK